MNPEQITMIVAVAALFLTIAGWIITYITSVTLVRKSLQLNMDYEIYKSVLERTNSIIGKVSVYTTSLDSHTSSMANILNEVNKTPRPSDERTSSLASQWAAETWGIATKGYAIQEDVIEYMRFLDMSGSDFHSDTIIYKALLTTRADAVEAITSINDKWIELDLGNTTVRQYDRLKKDTSKEKTKINEFTECLEDTLKHIYNGMIASNTGKSKKLIDTSEKRKMITASGLVDNRFEVNAK